MADEELFFVRDRHLEYPVFDEIGRAHV